LKEILHTASVPDLLIIIIVNNDMAQRMRPGKRKENMLSKLAFPNLD